MFHDDQVEGWDCTGPLLYGGALPGRSPMWVQVGGGGLLVLSGSVPQCSTSYCVCVRSNRKDLHHHTSVLAAKCTSLPPSPCLANTRSWPRPSHPRPSRWPHSSLSPPAVARPSPSRPLHRAMCSLLTVLLPAPNLCLQATQASGDNAPVARAKVRHSTPPRPLVCRHALPYIIPTTVLLSLGTSAA